MTIKNFEDLKIWQLSIELSIKIYQVTKTFPKSELFSLTDQLRRAVTSIGANIAEGFGRQYQKEKIQYLYQSRGSLYEVKHFLYISEKLGYISNPELNDILQDIEYLAKSINSFITSLQRYRTNQLAN